MPSRNHSTRGSRLRLAVRARIGSVSLALFVAGIAIARPLIAQTPRRIATETFAGGEVEDYLRILQDLGEVSPHPWSIRPFSPRELDRFGNSTVPHPWSNRYLLRRDSARGIRLHWIEPRADVIYNSAFPYGFNDGPVWAGRGLTSVVRGGASFRYGFFTLILDPIYFRAENTSFELADNGRTGRLAFADPAYPATIDAPQRFGSEPYQRFDWGQSTFRIDLPVVTAGVSTADQVWGPGQEFPLILGNNAAGFPHAFLGTSTPLNLWIGKVHGRLVWGVLHQSRYSPFSGDETRRFMSGLVGVFTPRGIPGLEIGGSRFYHTPWPEDGLEFSNFTKPLEGFLKAGLDDTGISDGKSDADNQLASAFMRWVFPHSGIEIYGEYAREDHNWDLRDFTLEPDQDSGYMLGLQRSIRLDSLRILAIRGEMLNTSPSNLTRVRAQTVFYRHSPVRQGHTEEGQILGSPAAYGGSGAIIAADYYEPRGRLSVSWLRQKVRPRSLDGLTPGNIQNAITVQSVYYVGVGDVSVGLTGVHESDRIIGSSSFNLNASVGMRWSY